MEVLMVRVKQGKITAEFKWDALRILSTSSRTVAEVAVDLGIGKSTLQRWKTEARETKLLSGPHPDVEKELARLRHETCASPRMHAELKAVGLSCGRHRIAQLMIAMAGRTGT
jgi:transposase